MAILISHTPDGDTRSALTLTNLGKHLAHVLTAAEWAELVHLFGPALNPPHALTPTTARRIGNLLHQAAGHRLMPHDWGTLAQTLGDAAERAARTGEQWTWS
jgi:hypothetical protein